MSQLSNNAQSPTPDARPPAREGAPLTPARPTLPARAYGTVAPAAPAKPRCIDWPSLLVVYFTLLVVDAARGLLIPSAWPRVQALHGTKDKLGFFTSSLSLGRVLGTVPLGQLSDRYSPGAVLAAGAAVQIGGHLLYAVAPNLATLFAARVVVGLGSTLSVCRAHVTRAIPPHLRTHHFAYLSGLQFIGYAVLPGPGGMMAALPEFSLFGGRVVFNGFTYPAYALAAANALVIVLLRMFYVAPPLSAARVYDDEASSSSTSQSEDDEAWSADDARVGAPDLAAVGLCIVLNMLFTGVMAQMETITVPFVMEQFDLTYQAGSVYLSFTGVVGLLIYLLFKPIARAFSDRFLVGFGLACVVAGCAPLAIRPVSEMLPFAVYMTCVALIWNVAYPVGQTAALALFSKVLADLPVGGLLGLFSLSGAASRMCFGSAVGWVWGTFGREAVFLSLTATVGVVMAAFVYCYGRLAGPAERRQS